MYLKNGDIYNTLIALEKAFKDETRYFPAKLTFYIEYNKKQLFEASESISASIYKIFKEYGDDSGTIPPEKMEIANAELAELSSIKQKIDIKKISLKDLESMEFTPQQMQALLIMINDEEEEQK